MNERLKPCPFCGTEQNSDSNDWRQVRLHSKVIKKNGYGMEITPQTVFWVQCGNCLAKGGSGTAHYNGLTKTTVTEERAAEIAVNNWNRRV